MLLSKVVLVKNIRYKKNKKLMLVRKGTEVLVDTKKNIALIGSDHVDIKNNEYIVITMFH